MYRPYPPDPASAEAGPSRPRLEPANPLPPSELPNKPKKRRRLQFSSELRTNNIQRYNPDGTETVEYLHQQSTQRLKRKWDSIFERFKDAHLQEQDEIYLGNRANGEPIVVVKDRGSLRSLRQSMEFGVFIKDEELQGWKDRPEAREMQEQEDDDEDDFDPSRMPSSHRTQLAGASSSESEDEEEDPAVNDPDLREFLQAEARRKAMLGKAADEDESDQEQEDDVVDFANPRWNDYRPSTSAMVHPPAPATVRKTVRTTVRRPSPSAAPSQTKAESPALVFSSSEDDDDDDDTDIVTVHSDSDEELIDSIRTKRQNIEELLQCTTPFETLPYNDIFGLADLLKLTDNTARLYVDLVSDDEDQDAPAEREKSAEGTVGRQDVIDLTHSLPTSSLPHSSLPHSPLPHSSLPNSSLPNSSLPNSSIVVDPASSSLSEFTSSRASSVVPVAPASERSASPVEETLVEQPTPVQSTPAQFVPVEIIPAEPTPAEAVSREVEPTHAEMQVHHSPVEAHSPREEAPVALTFEPREPTPATPPPPSPRPSLPTVRPSQPESLAAETPPAAAVELRLPLPSAPEPAATSATAEISGPSAEVESATLSHVRPHRDRESQPAQPTPARTHSQKSTRTFFAEKQKATPKLSPSRTFNTSSTPIASSRRHVSAPSSSSHSTKRTPSSAAERRLEKRQPRSSRSRTSLDGDDSRRAVREAKKPVCGGLGKCTKTFCLHCASRSRG